MNAEEFLGSRQCPGTEWVRQSLLKERRKERRKEGRMDGSVLAPEMGVN